MLGIGGHLGSPLVTPQITFQLCLQTERFQPDTTGATCLLQRWSEFVGHPSPTSSGFDVHAVTMGYHQCVMLQNDDPGPVDGISMYLISISILR